MALPERFPCLLWKPPEDGQSRHPQMWGPRGSPEDLQRTPSCIPWWMDTAGGEGCRDRRLLGMSHAHPNIRWPYLPSQKAQLPHPSWEILGNPEFTSMSKQGGNKSSRSRDKSHPEMGKQSSLPIPFRVSSWLKMSALKEWTKTFITFNSALNMDGCKGLAEVLVDIADSSHQTLVLLRCSEKCRAPLHVEQQSLKYLMVPIPGACCLGGHWWKCLLVSGQKLMLLHQL